MKNYLNLFIALLVITLLAGCPKNQNYTNQMTPSQIQAQNAQNTIRDAQRNSVTCLENLRNPTSNPEAGSINLVDKEVLFFKEDSANKVALMTSSSKINETQKKAIFKYIESNQLCRNALKRDISGFPTLVTIYDNYYGDMDIVYADLISKKITIGDANKNKAKLVAKAKSEYSQALQNLDNRYTQQINQEVQAAQADAAQRRALAAQYLMNQQNIAAQQNIANQQNLQNQLNNSRPVNTTCNRYGSQVNCTSY